MPTPPCPPPTSVCPQSVPRSWARASPRSPTRTRSGRARPAHGPVSAEPQRERLRARRLLGTGKGKRPLQELETPPQGSWRERVPLEPPPVRTPEEALGATRVSSSYRERDSQQTGWNRLQAAEPEPETEREPVRRGARARAAIGNPGRAAGPGHGARRLRRPGTGRPAGQALPGAGGHGSLLRLAVHPRVPWGWEGLGDRVSAAVTGSVSPSCGRGAGKATTSSSKY